MVKYQISSEINGPFLVFVEKKPSSSQSNSTPSLCFIRRASFRPRYYQIAPPKQKLHSLLYPGHCRRFLYTPLNFLCHDEPLILDQPQPVGTVWWALRGDVPADL